MKKLIALTTVMICNIVLASSITIVTAELSIEEAVSQGAVIEIKETSDIEFRMNFSQFNVCVPAEVNLQSLNAQGQVQSSSSLANTSNWYSLQLSESTLKKHRLALTCATGNRNVYFIHLSQGNA